MMLTRMCLIHGEAHLSIIGNVSNPGSKSYAFPKSSLLFPVVRVSPPSDTGISSAVFTSSEDLEVSNFNLFGNDSEFDELGVEGMLEISSASSSSMCIQVLQQRRPPQLHLTFQERQDIVCLHTSTCNA